MKVQHDAGALKLWNQRRKDEHVRHIVDMYEVILGLPAATQQKPEGGEDKAAILDEIVQLASAGFLPWHTKDVNAVDDLMLGFALFLPQAHEIDIHSCADEGLGGAPRTRVVGILGIQKNGRPFAIEPFRVRREDRFVRGVGGAVLSRRKTPMVLAVPVSKLPWARMPECFGIAILQVDKEIAVVPHWEFLSVADDT